jgi:hypothetical protein
MTLAGEGVPVRDIGEVLEVSDQRAQQLVATSPHTKRSDGARTS